MKKLFLALPILALSLVMGSAQAHALPTFDGLISPGEWSNMSFPFWRMTPDPAPEAGIRAGTDLDQAIMFQSFTGAPATDGIYLAISTIGAVDFTDASPLSSEKAIFLLDGHFNACSGGGPPGCDFIPEFTIEIAADAGGVVHALVTLNDFPLPFNGDFTGPTGDIVLAGGALAVGPDIELYIPTGSFASPALPFPGSFVGFISSFDGGTGRDDELISLANTAIPEPTSLFLMGAGVLGLLGFGRKKKL